MFKWLSAVVLLVIALPIQSHHHHHHHGYYGYGLGFGGLFSSYSPYYSNYSPYYGYGSSSYYPSVNSAGCSGYIVDYLGGMPRYYCNCGVYGSSYQYNGCAPNNYAKKA